MSNEKIQILENTLGIYYKSRDEHLFKCPFCSHHKRKLSINIKLNVFKCWICNTKGGLIYLIKRFASKKDWSQWSLQEETTDLSDINDLFFEQAKEVVKQTIELPKEFVWLGSSRLPNAAKDALNYLTDRGITKADIRFYKIGACFKGEYRRRIIIPSFNSEGDCNYFIARSYKDDWLKYKNPPVSRNIIFNDLLIDWKNPITIVEGIFDSIKTDNSIPILGSTINIKSDLFQKLVEKQPKIYIGLDHDALSKSLNVINSMISYGLEVEQINTSDIEDLGSLTKQEVIALKNNAIPMTFENILQMQWR
jgi:DNA primase